MFTEVEMSGFSWNIEELKEASKNGSLIDFLSNKNKLIELPTVLALVAPYSLRFAPSCEGDFERTREELPSDELGPDKWVEESSSSEPLIILNK